MNTPLRLGISTCPNDTFAFAGILRGQVAIDGPAWSIELADVQELNESFARGAFDVAKGSFAAALRLSDEITVLPVGAALGFGVGPVLLARGPGIDPERSTRTLGPGADTTAALLFRIFHSAARPPEHVVFSEIMPALIRGEADLGVCIHEGRFTYGDVGLTRVEDLGERWEQATRGPLPLGGLFARRTVDPAALASLVRGIRASIDWAVAHPEEARDTMAEHAQEHSDGVLWKHVELYVNERTRDLGPEGEAALAELSARAASCAWVPTEQPALEVFQP